MNKRLTNAVLAAAGVVLVGCETMNTTPPPRPTTTLHYKLPTLTPVEPDKQDQEKDGIRISVAPYSYTTRTLVRREYRRAPALFIVAISSRLT
jgi:predicted component of type VI protein secretion system